MSWQKKGCKNSLAYFRGRTFGFLLRLSLYMKNTLKTKFARGTAATALITLALTNSSLAGTLSFTGSEYQYTAGSEEVNGVDLRDHKSVQFNIKR